MNNKLLLHVCCGPCAMYPTKYFINNNIEFDAYFYNPNIHPIAEWNLRLINAQKAAELRNYKMFVNNEVLQETWESFDKNFNRCKFCYDIRLDECFKFAKKNNYKAVTTTLLVSPYQKHELILEMLKEKSKQYGVPYYYHDFREGYHEGQREAKENGIYCQKYCGCIFSFKDSIEFINKLRKEPNKNFSINL